MFGKCDYKEALANLELSVYNFNKTSINNSLKGNALYMIGCAQESLGHIDQAVESLKYALVLNEKRPEAHRNHKDIARTLRRLGAVFKLKGEYSKSRKYLKKSLLLSVSEFGPHHCEVAQTHEFLAGTLYLEGNHEEALQHVQATLDIYDSDGNSTILGRCYCLKGVILDQTSKDSELAIKVFKTSIEHYESSPDDQKDYMGLASAVLKLATLQDCNQIYPSATKNYISKSKSMN
jgi:tetratricopeptide (TPR) repeat protein